MKQLAFGRRSLRHGRRFNVARWEPKAVRLACGHSTTAHAVVIYPNRRSLYDCAEGCGLQKARWRKSGL